MADFSGAIKLANLDDFLAPSQACIKPLMGEEEDKKDTKNKGAVVKIEVEVDTDLGPQSSIRPKTLSSSTDGHFNQIKFDKVKKTATVSLNDCLACSGCVTSAETVLITAQSAPEFYLNVENKDKITIVTLSPQSRTALAFYYSMDEIEFTKKLTGWFKSIGVTYIFDSTFAMDIALLETQEEFISRYKSKKNLPMLASECPGWICYAEKKVSEILPLISTTKSPQQIMGTLIKKYLSKKLKVTPDKIFHTTIMPCYDKKLEGSRDDFFDKDYLTRDADCVLTTHELKDILEEKKIDLKQLNAVPLDQYTSIDSEGKKLYRPIDTGGSGGYLENIFRATSKQLFNVDLSNKDLKYKINRNNDYKEVSLEIEGKNVLTFAICYGFSNIQNLVRKIKNKQCHYHYIEIMACPSGCLNGGGQIKAIGGIKAQKELVKKLDQLYHEREIRLPQDNPVVSELYKDWVQGVPYSSQAQNLFHTQYHAVAKMESTNPLALKW